MIYQDEQCEPRKAFQINHFPRLSKSPDKSKQGTESSGLAFVANCIGIYFQGNQLANQTSCLLVCSQQLRMCEAVARVHAREVIANETFVSFVF